MAKINLGLVRNTQEKIGFVHPTIKTMLKIFLIFFVIGFVGGIAKFSDFIGGLGIGILLGIVAVLCSLFFLHW